MPMLSARTQSAGVRVDREAKVLRGYVVAQAGPFKSEGRGQFDQQSLQSIVTLYRDAGSAGLKSRFSHPTACDDGLGSFLGRSKDARLDGDKVRADLHLDPTSFTSPKGNLGQYVLDLAATDPDALSSSLVLRADKEKLLDPAGRPKLDADGQEIPPVWRPTKLHASDVVETGDAVDGLLSAGIDVDDLPAGILWRATESLNTLFAGRDRADVEARLLAFTSRYLDERYGVAPADHAGALALRLRLLEFSK